MRTFTLERLIDDSGVSGTGKVAEGVVWSNGEVVLHWLGRIASTTEYHSVADMMEVHGHGGHTRLKWHYGEESL